MKGGQSGPLKQVELVCQACGTTSFIWRRACKLKEKGHVKHLWCPKCQGRTPHEEVRE